MFKRGLAAYWEEDEKTPPPAGIIESKGHPPSYIFPFYRVFTALLGVLKRALHHHHIHVFQTLMWTPKSGLRNKCAVTASLTEYFPEI